MTDFTAFHVGTARPGGFAWIAGQPYNYDPPRGCVAIEDDSSTWFYRVDRSRRGEFRRWATGVFCGTMDCRRLRGTWPHYRVERP